MPYKSKDEKSRYQRKYYREWYKKNGRTRNSNYSDNAIKWGKDHPNSIVAKEKVRWAIISGKLIRPNKCDICEREARIIAHHDDYSKPLIVTWVCASCHKLIHQISKPIDKPYSKNHNKKGDIDETTIMLYNNTMSSKFIDLDNLRVAIQEMTYQQGLYKVLRDELKKKGYWRVKSRGNPKLGYQVMKAKKAKD